MTTTRLGVTLASAKISVMNCTALRPKAAVVMKSRYTYWAFCCPSLTDLATLAVMASAAEMSMRKGTRFCWATGTMAAVCCEWKAPVRITAPALMRRSASVRATSGLVCESPSKSSSLAPPMDLTPPAALTASTPI